MTKHIGNRVGSAVTFTTDGGVFNSFSQFYFAKRSTGVQATGGTFFTSGTYNYHVFLAPGTFTIIGGTATIDYLVVAGGASSGSTLAGGGGAGGFRTGTFPGLSPNFYAVTVGAGGAAPTAQAPVSGNGNSGNPSTFHTITSTGGGAGGHYESPGLAGGSGGGGGGGNAPYPGGAGNTPPVSPSQGNNGGATQAIGNQGGGGGGAGAVGALNGGAGLAAFSGDSTVPASYGTPGPTAGRWFAGGGGAGARSGYGGGTGGAGGGGAGSGSGNGVDGTVNTGGGGGSGFYPGPATNGAGGSGIVILRYLVT